MIPAIKSAFWSRQDIPLVMQIEAAECGLACLTMIATHHGHEVSLRDMRRRFGISLKGATLADLIKVADHVGFAARPLRLDVEELSELKLPCILHWDLNHFVVLARVTKTHVVLHDPAQGIRAVTIEDASRHFTGVALELTPTSRLEKRQANARMRVRDVIGQVRGLSRVMTLLLVLAVVIELFGIISPLFIGWIVDHVLVAADRDLLSTLSLAFGLILALRLVLTATRSLYLLHFNSQIRIQARSNLFQHLVNLPNPYFETRHIGDIVARFGSQERILHAVTEEMVEILLDGALCLITLVVMFIIAPDITALVIVGALLYAGLRLASYSYLKNLSAEEIVWSARRDSHFLETIRGIRAIKLFNGQMDRRIEWLNLTVQSMNRQIDADRLRIAFRIANALLLGLLYIAVVWLGASRVLEGAFSIGLLLAFVAYKDQFLTRVSALIDNGFEVRMLQLHAERLADIAQETPEAGDPPSVIHASDPSTVDLELRNVSFRYSDHEPWILRHVNLRIRAGESIVITGPSGGGKTTLLKLVAGLLQPSEGEVLVNGQPIAQFGLNRYRRLMGVVMQDDHLFAGSIADNITFFSPAPDHDDIIRCARLAAIDSEISAMPMGYHSLIGDMGTILSGGQKQRVLIARALYRKPRVMILDEATSHLDVGNEKSVSEALKSTRMTRVMVAHRPETIRTADREVPLRDGTIASPMRAV